MSVPEQNGCKKISTENAVFTLTVNNLTTVDKQKQIEGVCCDAAKAFDFKSYVYGTVQDCDSLRIGDQLNVTSYYVLFHFFYAQHFLDINTSIIRSLRLLHNK